MVVTISTPPLPLFDFFKFEAALLLLYKNAMGLENNSTGKILNSLNKACIEGDMVTFQQIIPEGSLKATPLTLEYIRRGNAIGSLIQYGRTNMLDYLFDQGLNIKDISPGLVEHLRFLVLDNQYYTLCYLIKKGVSIKRIIKDTLMDACNGSSPDILDLFIANGVTIDKIIDTDYERFCRSMTDTIMYYKYIKMGFCAEHIYNNKLIFSYACIIPDNKELVENLCFMIKDSPYAEEIAKARVADIPLNDSPLERCIKNGYLTSAKILLRNFHFTDEEKKKAALPEELMDIQYEEPLGPKFAAFGI